MILSDVPFVQIIEQFTTTRDHLEQSSTRVIVLFMDLEMLGQFIDPLRKQRDLDRGRPGVAIVRFVIADYFFLNFFDCCHKN